jgi:hypothetical protein
MVFLERLKSMLNHVQTAIRELPSRARVGLALTSAERALASLADFPDVCSLGYRGLEDAWRWVDSTAGRSLDLYNQIDPLAFASTDLAADTTQHNAVLAVVSALYYAAGEIATYETPENAHQLFSPLGSDMADVGSEDLVECLERAADSAMDVEAEIQWQQKLIDRLLSDFHTVDPYQPGSSIRRDYFLIR